MRIIQLRFDEKIWMKFFKYKLEMQDKIKEKLNWEEFFIKLLFERKK